MDMIRNNKLVRVFLKAKDPETLKHKVVEIEIPGPPDRSGIFIEHAINVNMTTFLGSDIKEELSKRDIKEKDILSIQFDNSDTEPYSGTRESNFNATQDKKEIETRHTLVKDDNEHRRRIEEIKKKYSL